mgnify:CR=1 FL=1
MLSYNFFPNRNQTPQKKRIEAVEEKIRAKLGDLRTMLQADGGDMDVVSIKDKAVRVRLKGACGCCPHATMTIKQGLERILREEIDPEITIEQVK